MGGTVIPEINVTSVPGDRAINGERVKPLTDNDALHENCSESRTESKPEIRRQKSVRRLMEDGMSSHGRVQC